MNKFFPLLAALVVVLALLIALASALASASASLANGVANAAASSALLVSQCTLAVMVLVSLAAGVTIGSGIAGLRARRHLDGDQDLLQPAQTRHLGAAHEYRHPLYLPEPTEPEEADEAIFQHWGW